MALPSLRERSPGAQRARQARARRGELEDRKEREGDRGEQRDAQGDQQDRGVDPHGHDPGQLLGAQRDEQRQAEIGDRQACRPAREPQDHALAEDHARDGAPAGAERGPNGELRPLRLRADQHQVRDVRARDQQQQGDGSHHQPQGLVQVPDHAVLQVLQVRPEPRVLPGSRAVLRPEDRDHARDVRVRFLEGDALLESGDGAAVERGEPGLRTHGLERVVDVGRIPEEAERRGQHSDDLPGHAVHHQRPPERIGAAELPLPVAVGDHGGRKAAGTVVFRRESPSEDRLAAQQGQDLVRDLQALDRLRLSRAADRHRRLVPVPIPHAVERLVVIGVGEVDGGRGVEPADPQVGRLVHHFDQAFLLRVRQRPQQHAVHDAEHGGGGADAEGEREDGHDRERGSAPQGARRVAEVAKEVLDGAETVLVARALAGARHAPELDQRLPARLLGRHAGLQVLLRLPVDVEPDLLVEAALQLTAADEPQQPTPSLPRSRHRSLSYAAASRTRLMARDIRRHWASSSVSWRRPWAVSA